jgi:hypothetical protein
MNRFDVLRFWAASEILNGPTIARWLALFEYFADLARELWGMSDFLDGLAIAAGMNSNVIYGLKNHRAALPPHVWPCQKLLTGL